MNTDNSVVVDYPVLPTMPTMVEAAQILTTIKASEMTVPETEFEARDAIDSTKSDIDLEVGPAAAETAAAKTAAAKTADSAETTDTAEARKEPAVETVKKSYKMKPKKKKTALKVDVD